MNYYPWVIIKVHAEQLSGRIAFIWVYVLMRKGNTQCAHLHNVFPQQQHCNKFHNKEFATKTEIMP